jgi:voltage-gated potassium channel
MESPTKRWRTLTRLEALLRTPMVLLSLVWLAIVVLQLMGHANGFLAGVATIIWVLFIIEFAVSFALAPSKLVYLKRNWLTVVALIVPALRLFRAVAALRALSSLRGVQLVRIVGTANRGMNALRGTLKRRGFGYVGALTLLVVALGAAGMLYFEPAKEVRGGFHDYWDSLWWTGMLLTTIGSQYWPVTPEGRALGFLLSLYGVGVLGYLAATFASWFIGQDAAKPDGPVAGAAELEALKQEIAALRVAIERDHSDAEGSAPAEEAERSDRIRPLRRRSP